MTRLAAIYNCFADSSELLPYSLNCLIGHVDEIIIVYQDISNYGEPIPFEKLSDKFIKNIFSNFTYVKYSPNVSFSGTVNETLKRNLGLQTAKENGCTHYFCCDSDELWENFSLAKQQYFDSGHKASVASMWTFFKDPTLRFQNKDNYYVPFICELTPESNVGNNRCKYICDPTRKPNEQDVILIEEPMWHYSWVRKDILLKVRNSSAQVNIGNSNRLHDYRNPDCKEGYYVKDFQQKLIKVENTFNINI